MNLTDDELLAVAFLVRHHRTARLPVPPRVGVLAQRVEHELTQLRCAATGTGDHHDQTRWIGTTEVAHRLGCSERHARNLAERLGGQRISGRWIIPENALEGL